MIKRKLAFICTKGLETFIDPIAAEFEREGTYKVRRYYVASNGEVHAAVKWADIAFIEWANEVAVIATDMHEIKDKAVIVRLHSYEAFTDLPQKIDWTKVDYLIFVASHVRDIVESNNPGLIKNVCTKVISNGVNPAEHMIEPDQDPFSLAYVANISHKKTPVLALQILAELAKNNQKYRLHVAGTFQDPRYQVYMTHMIKEMGLVDNVIFYGHLQDMTDFWKGKSIILSTSIHEGHPLNVIEGAMRGILPVIHNSLGTEALYPQDWRYNTVGEAVDMILSKDRGAKWTTENIRGYAIGAGWTRAAQVKQIANLIKKAERK